MKLSDIEGHYNLELEKAIKTIQKEKAKTVLLQFPEGLKNKALEVSRELEKSTGANCLIWMGSCFGACDIPQPSVIDSLKVDLVIQWGHSAWPFKNKKEGKKESKESEKSGKGEKGIKVLH